MERKKFLRLSAGNKMTQIKWNFWHSIEKIQILAPKSRPNVTKSFFNLFTRDHPPTLIFLPVITPQHLLCKYINVCKPIFALASKYHLISAEFALQTYLWRYCLVTIANTFATPHSRKRKTFNHTQTETGQKDPILGPGQNPHKMSLKNLLVICAIVKVRVIFTFPTPKPTSRRH